MGGGLYIRQPERHEWPEARPVKNVIPIGDTLGTARERSPTNNPAKDATDWEAVEEATELLQEGRYPEALLALREVIKADPRNAYAYNYLGLAFFEIKNLEAARDAYRAAVRVAPDYLGARVALSHALRMLGDTNGALAHAKDALRRFPKDGEALHAAGMANAAKGNRTEAKQQLEGYLGQNPELESQQEVRQILEMLGLGEEGEPLEVEGD
jgi:Flp pilus assembly protein TadD